MHIETSHPPDYRNPPAVNIRKVNKHENLEKMQNCYNNNIQNNKKNTIQQEITISNPQINSYFSYLNYAQMDCQDNVTQQIQKFKNFYITEQTNIVKKQENTLNPEIYDSFLRFCQAQANSQYSKHTIFDEFSRISFQPKNKAILKNSTNYDQNAHSTSYYFPDISKNKLIPKPDDSLDLNIRKNNQNGFNKNEIESNPIRNFNINEIDELFYLKNAQYHEKILAEKFPFIQINGEDKLYLPIFEGKRVITIPGHEPIDLDYPYK
ncbi:hypothetical protein EDEG_03757 [Edhazardia aedis USNM 41457]|uniref:Uncharacterized protein n=1 Tax=Edhazardia aedis (strain USNM 41457) TaxID=1003232 RepID=J9D2B0_EDHAE|nr:hypothetical protein EDEG_03757 [Edhazardia aedis USNM 41457]|eukprot:EJW01714.1 hypothetical protein EDEG_03757 [Edhazardia aedis USNM 41457]